MKAADIPDRTMLEAIRDRRVRSLPYPAKVVRAKLLRFDRRGWITYGVSLETAWLTTAGEAALIHMEGT